MVFRRKIHIFTDCMELSIQNNGNVVLAEFIGRLDTVGANEIAPRIEALKAEAAKTLVLDCSQMDYISSAGIRFFMTLRKASAVKGGKIILTGLSEYVSDIFRMVGLLDLFEVR